MNGFLNQSQIEYILFHLNHSCTVSGELRERFVFNRGSRERKGTGRIIFQMSDEALVFNNIIHEQGIPVLFPGPSKDKFYEKQGDNLVFHHDLLKASFYLLSGYQELQPEKLDSMGRYPYEGSIQKLLEIANKPLVNYYFDILIEGFDEFCRLHNIPFKRRAVFRNFAFFLTHDVDSVDTYTLYEAGYRVKQAMGMADRTYSWARTVRIAIRYLYQSLNVFGRKNPNWDFSSLRKAEEKYGFRSAFYFLPKDKIHVDAYYSFHEKRIRKLFQFLNDQQCELGIHGTVHSTTSCEALTGDIKELEKYISLPVRGIRQHRLMFDRNVTHNVHQKAGLLYDTSLGFAEQEGFRNSYCLPFRPYDHASGTIMDIWELPLTVMDVTLFNYRKLTFEGAMDAVIKLLDEINKFNGIFVLLWHNGQNDEFRLPGITKFYLDLLDTIADRNPENLLGPEIIKLIDIE